MSIDDQHFTDTVDPTVTAAVAEILLRVDADLADASPPAGEVLRLLREHATRPELEPAGLAAALGFDAQARLNAFADEYGLTAERYLVHLRLEIAAILLAETDLPIGQVGRLSGFAEASAFRNIFRHHVHLHPGELRKAVRRARSNPDPAPPLGESLPDPELHRLAQRLSEEIWALLSALPPRHRTRLLRHGEIRFGSREMIDLLLARSAEVDQDDPRRAAEIAQLALDCLAGSAELLGLEVRELRRLAEKRLAEALAGVTA